MMGLLDGFLPGDWRGLLNAPIRQPPPPDITSPLMPPAGAADETAEPPDPLPRNLTAHALRMKGVSEADIAAALGSPALMQQLVIRNFGPGAGSATDGRPTGYPDQAFDPQTDVPDDDGAHSDAPPWSRYAPPGPPESGGDARRDGYLGKIPLSWTHGADPMADRAPGSGFADRARNGSSPATQNDLFNASQENPDRNAPGARVQLAQYAPASPVMPLPMPGGVFLPGTRENQDFTRDFIHSGIRAGQAIGEAIGSISRNEQNKPQAPTITPRPDLPPLAGDRGGQRVPSLTGPPNSAIPGAPGRIFITDATGNVVADVTRERVKDITPGGRAGKKRSPTPNELDLLDKMGR